MMHLQGGFIAIAIFDHVYERKHAIEFSCSFDWAMLEQAPKTFQEHVQSGHNPKQLECCVSHYR